MEDTVMAQCPLSWWSPEAVPAEAGQALREPTQRCPASFIAALSTYG